MTAKRRRGRRTVRRRVARGAGGRRRVKRMPRGYGRGQHGGFFPLLALIPAAIAAAKAATLGAVGGAAGYGIKKALGKA